MARRMASVGVVTVSLRKSEYFMAARSPGGNSLSL
jgi:hypothetical protein